MCLIPNKYFPCNKFDNRLLYYDDCDEYLPYVPRYYVTQNYLPLDLLLKVLILIETTGHLQLSLR